MGEQNVEVMVRDAILDKLVETIDRNLASAAKERMAIEDVAAIADALVADVIAPYVAQVARAPHEVSMADLSSDRGGARALRALLTEEPSND